MAAEDGWGLELYGLDPWGSITFPTLPPALAMTAEILNFKLVRLNFNTSLTTDSNFYNPDNYSIPGLGVKRVVPLSRQVSSFVLLETELQSETVEYTVSVSNLLTRDGSSVAASASWVARTTKGQTAVNNMPSVWSRSPNSRVASLLTAIGEQDDLIGGSRKDYLPTL